MHVVKSIQKHIKYLLNTANFLFTYILRVETGHKTQNNTTRIEKQCGNLG